MATTGTGGLPSSLKELCPSVRVIGARRRAHAFRVAQSRLVTLTGTNTIADGLKPVRAGDLTFEAVRRYVDEVVLVPDTTIMEAVAQLVKLEKSWSWNPPEQRALPPCAQERSWSRRPLCAYFRVATLRLSSCAYSDPPGDRSAAGPRAGQIGAR